MYKYVCHVTVYFKKELHRIHRKTCLMDLSIGLRLPVLDINREVNKLNWKVLSAHLKLWKIMVFAIKTFVSDRHRGIAKWIRENQKDTCRFCDIWHVARSVMKKLFKASRENGCELIKDWMKGIKQHIYWCATSTLPGFGSLIKAKWNSFMRHVLHCFQNAIMGIYQQGSG